MPVRFRLTIERTGNAKSWPSAYVAAYSIRGAVVPFLRDTARLEGIHGQRYSIHVAPPADTDAHTVHAEFCLLSDSHGPRAHQALQDMCSQARPITIGDVAAHVAHVAVAAFAMGEPAPAEYVEITFMSVTTFAAGNRRARAVPDPTLIIKSWSSSWNRRENCPEVCRPEVIDDLGQHLEPIDGVLAWSDARFRRNPDRDAASVHAPYTILGFTGNLTLRLHRSATPEAAEWLSRLAWLAGFAGTGYHPQIGLGATRAITRPQSAGSTHHRKPPSSADAI